MHNCKAANCVLRFVFLALEVHDQTKTGLSGDPCEGHPTEGAKVWSMDFRGGGGVVFHHIQI